ncbi:MAG: carboxypeptidase regulatory-like domain-containing protein, partial [Ginsengibacter sp.]
MKKTISVLLASMLFSIISFGQNGIVTGIVKDNSNQPIPYATIQISKMVDSITIKATVTDKNGSFQVGKIENGHYLISVSSTGFENQSTSFLIDSLHQKIIFPDFKLIASKNILEAVTVTTSKKFIEVKADKTILNIENNIMASGNSAFDMIKKGPAVSTDKDDNIKMKGGLVQIFVDGKPFYLAGQQLTDYLKSLPADAVSKIEIISNPGSRYEAQGTAGIINLKLKKSQANGLNGTASVGAGIGRYPKANGSVSLNYRKDKWNIFGSG